MGLDYWNPNQVVNFRDVGEFINMISGKILMPVGRLFRGGTLRYIESLSVINNPKTIFNLQKGPDPIFDECTVFHFPISNDYEKYITSTPEVRIWLNTIIKILQDGIDFPLYMHCHSGKDRTGIVIASLLMILGIPREWIIEEYLLSEGEVSRDRIETSLDEISPVEAYFKRVNLDHIRRSFVGTPEQLHLD